MAHLNAGQMAEATAEFKTYVDREPNGRFAAQASGILVQSAVGRDSSPEAPTAAHPAGSHTVALP